MDKKMLIMIFVVVSSLIITGYIYVSYSKLIEKIEELEKWRASGNNKSVLEKFENDSGYTSENDNTPSPLKENISKINNDNLAMSETININTHLETVNTVMSTSTSESQSVDAVRNEVEELENQLKNVEELIHTQSADEVLNYDELDKQTSGRIDSILDDSNQYSNMLNSNKNNSSEFDDLENVPNENNSELNQLIKQESLNDNTLEMYSNNINENDSEDNLNSLEQLENNVNMDDIINHETNNDNLDNTETIEHTSQQSFDNINDETSDKQEIEISVIQKQFSVKNLKKICVDNNLGISGNKTTLIERIIKNNLSHELENSNITEKSENLTQ